MSFHIGDFVIVHYKGDIGKITNIVKFENETYYKIDFDNYEFSISDWVNEKYIIKPVLICA